MNEISKQKIGYARISTTSQKLDSLNQVGCVKIFSDQTTGTTKERPGWNQLMDYIRPGDTLVIVELSRMSRSLAHLLEVIKELEKRHIEIISLRENIDTSTATGRCFLSIMGAIAQMELELKAERTAAGRIAAKARGKTGGRPKIPADTLEQAKILYENSDQVAAEVCKVFGIGRRTLFYYLARKTCDINIIIK